ncbi:hypothetical protein MCOR27_005718 [Pyricularia oryzae]|nr:hypothetical protein MCOR27_005718 [Pyricularia oryzae]KAI6323306.1 hypothetical protein MCOR30_007323 [Pyricularia oryzae]KAI6522732.1 hypothetical protein MCOR10_005545 [Pyricularia oryzae]KAI6545466.1 hypothetical protein MCOR05_001450 [Pyricularia oryzae]KAI6567894.1 hypothetical protein MCOR03_000783 [Pyricularia oryzae]
MAHNAPLLGLYPLFQDGGREWTPNGLDIVAVPGVDGHPFATWTASTSPENSMVGPLWLRDFLPGENLPDARVYSYGYDAKSWLTQSKGSDLKTFSDLMLQSIVWARDGKLANRPLVFVCHGVGGLVVKQALVTAHLNEKGYPGVHSSLKAVMFLGVPHRGAGSLTLHQIMADMLVLGGLKAASPPGPDLVTKLQAEPAGIDKLSTDFRKHIKPHVVLLSCYEEVNMNKNGSERCLVPRESAILDAPGEKIIPMISCNHVTMVKFYTRNDHNYKNVAFAISEVAKPSKSPSNAKPAPGKKEPYPATKKEPQPDIKKETKSGAKPEANSTAKREPPAVVPKVADAPKKTAEPAIREEAQPEPKKKEETIAGLGECLASLENACQQVHPQNNPKEVDTPTSLPFTMDRVSKNTQYRQWLNSSTDGLLVIQGETGSGKTTLAKQIFKSITASQPKTLVLKYSFKETSAVNLAGEQWRLSFWSSLVHQLMSRNAESLERLVRRHRRLRIALTPGFLPVWKPDELLEAMSREALPFVLKERNVIIFVDGIDACEKADELLDDLQKYLLQSPIPASTSGAKQTENTGRFCSKICVTSTREPAAKEKKQRQSIQMEENNVEDLEAYVHRQLQQVCALDQKGLILQRAQRSFLRARLLCEQAQQNIQQKPLESAKQLGDLYQHNLGALSPEHKSRGLNMIKWATFASRPLTLPELFVAIEMDSKIDSDITNLSVLFSPQKDVTTQLLTREADMEGIVNHLSRGLLKVTAEASGRKVVRPIHNSLAQLVMPPKVATEKVEKDTVTPSPESLVHLGMVNTCLRFLNIAMRDLQWRSRSCQDPGAIGTSAVRPEFAFSGYAESFWFRHAQVVEAGAGTLKPSLKWFGFTSSDGDRFLEDFIELARSCALGPLVLPLSNPQQEQKPKESQEKQADRAFEGAGWLHLFALYGLRTPLPAASKVKQVRKVDSRDQTPLHYAALQNHRSVVKSLVAYAQDRDHLGNTPLHLAAMQGNVDAIKAILKYSTVKNLANTPNSGGYMPLHHAVYYEHRSAAKALLDEKVGAKVDARLPNGKTPLMLAAEVGSHTLAAVLLDAKSGGADMNAADESGHTALTVAILNGSYSVVKILVLRETCAVGKVDCDGRTPLMHAVRCGNLAAAKLLLDKRTLEDKVADASAADGKQLTALLFAVSSLGVKGSDTWVGADAAAKVSDKMVKLLLDSGAQITCRDKEKRTTVAIALEAAKKTRGSDTDKALVVAGLLFTAYEKAKGADVAKWDCDWAESKKDYQALCNKQAPSAAPKTKDSVAKQLELGVSKPASKVDAPGTGTVVATATAAQAKLHSDKKVGAAVNGNASSNGTPAKPQPANGAAVTTGKNPTPSTQTKAQSETGTAPTASTNGAATAPTAKKGNEANTAAPLAAKQVASPESAPKQPPSKPPAGEKAAGVAKATPVVSQVVNPAKPAIAKPAAATAVSPVKGVGDAKPAPQTSQSAPKNAVPPATASKPSPQPTPQAKGVVDAKPVPLTTEATKPPRSTAAKTTSPGPAPLANGQKPPKVAAPTSPTGLQRKIGSTTRPPMPRARVSLEGGPAAAQQAAQVKPAQMPGGQQAPVPASSQPVKQVAGACPASPARSQAPPSQAAAAGPETTTPHMPASGPIKRKPIQSAAAADPAPASKPAFSQPPAAAINPAPAPKPAASQPSAAPLAQTQPHQTPAGIQKPPVQKQQSTQQQPPVPPKGGFLQKPMPPPKPAPSLGNVLQKPKPGESLQVAPQVQKQTAPAPAVRPAVPAGPTTGSPHQLQLQAQVKQPEKSTATAPLSQQQQQQQPCAKVPKPPPAASVPKKQEQQKFKPYAPPQGGPTTTAPNGQKPPAQIPQQTKTAQTAAKEQPRPAQQPSKEQQQQTQGPANNKQSPRSEPARRSSSFFSKFSDIFSSGKEKNDKPSPPSSVQGKGPGPQKSDPPKPSVTPFAPRASGQSSTVPQFQERPAENYVPYSPYSQGLASQQHISNYAAPQLYRQQHPGQYGHAQEGQFPSPYQQGHFGDERLQQFQPGFNHRNGVSQTGYNDWNHSQQSREVHPNTQGQPDRGSNSRPGVNPILLAGGAGLAAGAGTVLVCNVMQSQNNEPEQSERAISPDSRTYSSYMESQYPTEYSTRGSQHQTEPSTYGTENDYQPADDTNRSFIAADDLHLRFVQKHEKPLEVSDVEPEKEAHVASQLMNQRLALDMNDDVHSIPSLVPSTPSSPGFDRRSIDMGWEEYLIREGNDSPKPPASPLGRFEPDVDSQQFAPQPLSLKEHEQSEDEGPDVLDDDEDERRSVVSHISHISSRPPSRGFSAQSPYLPASDDENVPDDYALNYLSEHEDDLRNAGLSDAEARDDETDVKSLQSCTLNANEFKDNDEDHAQMHGTSMLDEEFDGKVSDDESSEQCDIHKSGDEIDAPEDRSIFGDYEPQHSTGIPDDDEDDGKSFEGYNDPDDAAGSDIGRFSHADAASQNGSEFGDGPHEGHMQDDGISENRDDENHSQEGHDDAHDIDHDDAHDIDGNPPVAGYAVPESPMSLHQQEHDRFQDTYREEHHTGAHDEQYRRQHQHENHSVMYNENSYDSPQTGGAQSQDYHDQYQAQQYPGNQFSQNQHVKEDEHDHQQYHAYSQISSHQPGSHPDHEQEQAPQNGAYHQGWAGAGQEHVARDSEDEASDHDGYGAPQQRYNQAQGRAAYASSNEEDQDDQFVGATNDDDGRDEDGDETPGGEYVADDGEADYGGHGYGNYDDGDY